LKNKKEKSEQSHTADHVLFS